jgi:hypothetical protein
MLRSHGLGRLMNPRRIPVTLGTAVGAAFAAALIGLANTPVARADGPDPFEDLFGATGFNSWTPAADASLLSSDPSLAASLDGTVETYMSDVTQADPITQLVASIDPSAFTYNLVTGGALGVQEVPITQDGIGDLALGSDYLLSSFAWLDAFTGPGGPSLLFDILFVPEIFLLGGA